MKLDLGGGVSVVYFTGNTVCLWVSLGDGHTVSWALNEAIHTSLHRTVSSVRWGIMGATLRRLGRTMLMVRLR